ncbi:MAG TPA: hypothetical protein PKJ26_01270 [Candidatus Woesebacteria bacterium]|nr:hypothetical protein [Candidatus Woesebacteria bacterium]HNS65105.1 hypothetical protein [Candidatus Woesebacteria bacterium]
MKKIFLFLFGITALIVVGTVLVLGYLGFVPVISSLFGSDKPRDLGVVATQENYDQYLAKADTTLKTLDAPVEGKSIVYSGSELLTTSFSQEEVTGRLNLSTWKYMPIDQVQVKFSPDGTVEVAGRLRMDRLDGFIAQVGGTQYSKADVEKGLDYLGVLTVNPVVYGKGTGSVTNNQVTAQIDYLEVGRLPVPLDKIDASGTFVSVANHIINNVPGLDVQQADFTGGKLNFTGSVPTEMKVLQ